MNEQIRTILAEDGTKTSKIRKLLLLGLTHREIADLVTRGNRGFVWNVYKRMRDGADRIRRDSHRHHHTRT